MSKQLHEMTRDELAGERDRLEAVKVSAKAGQRLIDGELAARDATEGMTPEALEAMGARVVRITLEGKVGPEGVASSEVSQ